MARTKFDLDKLVLDGFTICVHGDRAVGKTHLAGDMLRTEMKAGKVLYVNVAGEDGMRTLAGMGLGDIGETITDYKDLISIIDECGKARYQALAVDSLPLLAKLAILQITGGKDRAPCIPSRDQMKAGMVNEWPEVHRLMEGVATKIRKAAKYVMVLSSSDKAMEQLDLNATRPTLIAPNLPGKEATECAGWFDFMGYLEITPVRPNEFERTFNMVPDGVTRVRQRMPKMITSKIAIPVDIGGWSAIKKAIES